MTYKCPVCGKLTTREGVCIGNGAEGHDPRRLVEAADAPDLPLTLSEPIARVAADESGTRDLA